MRILIDRLRELVGGEEIPAFEPITTRPMALDIDEWDRRYDAGEFTEDDFRLLPEKTRGKNDKE